jgi:hypothetical protein
MNDAERDAAVDSHLKALDEEIARLRRLEAAMDRRIEAREQERQAMKEGLTSDAEDAQHS